MKKPIVLFICQRLYGGGAERVLVLLANFFAKKNYQVHILARKDNGHYALDENIKLMYYKTSSHLKFASVIRNEVLQLRPTVVISFEYFYNLLSCLACIGTHTRLIISERNDPSRVGAGFFKDIIRNTLYRFADVLVCQTEDAKKYFPTYIQKKAVIILNPILPNLINKEVDVRRKEIVTFCRLHKQKNLPLLIGAFADFWRTHKDYKLSIYGDGSEKEQLEACIRDNGLENVVQLHPASKNIHEIVVDAAMFVLPSNYEGLSNSMLEALVIGLPTICTDCPCGGARMVIENNKNGILIPVGEHKALVEAMTKVADDVTFSNQLSQEGRKLRERLSLETIGRKWCDLLLGS